MSEKKVFVYTNKETKEVVELLNATNKEVTLKNVETSVEFVVDTASFKKQYEKTEVKNVEVAETEETTEATEKDAKSPKKKTEKKASKKKEAKEEVKDDNEPEKVFAVVKVHGKEITVTNKDFHKAMNDRHADAVSRILDKETGKISEDFMSVLAENNLLEPANA